MNRLVLIGIADKRDPLAVRRTQLCIMQNHVNPVYGFTSLETTNDEQTWGWFHRQRIRGEVSS